MMLLLHVVSLVCTNVTYNTNGLQGSKIGRKSGAGAAVKKDLDFHGRIEVGMNGDAILDAILRDSRVCVSAGEGVSTKLLLAL